VEQEQFAVVLALYPHHVLLTTVQSNAALTSCQQKLVMPTRLVEEAMDTELLLKPLAGPQALLLANLEMEAIHSVLLIKFAAELKVHTPIAAPLETLATPTLTHALTQLPQLQRQPLVPQQPAPQLLLLLRLNSALLMDKHQD